MRAAHAFAFVALALVIASVASCTESSVGEYRFVDADGGEVAPSFQSPDAALDHDDGILKYCPSNKCPDGFTTCPNSAFPCDVDLRTDIENCGACGSTCVGVRAVDHFECIEGRCALQCYNDNGLDCDGLVDNGCETSPLDNDNCGACGNACTDPAKPCMAINGKVQCGCPSGQSVCNDGWSDQCVDLESDDNNCEVCGIACPPEGDGSPLQTNTYYGCAGGECGHVKCLPFTADCDGNTATGCEISLADVQNCGSCGNACAPGQGCYFVNGNTFACLCAQGETRCDWGCVDLATDALNCGSCNNVCNTDEVCIGGMCAQQCSVGKADCNGNAADGCEVNTNSDPRNCGGCGIACDATAGQPCAGGRCVVEPCPVADGGPVAR